MSKKKQKLELTWIGKEKRPRTQTGRHGKTEEVLAKKRAAQRWCEYANEHAVNIGGKQWQYLLIAHDELLTNASVDGLIARFS